jgi:hypothetical protein
LEGFASAVSVHHIVQSKYTSLRGFVLGAITIWLISWVSVMFSFSSVKYLEMP